MSRFYTSFKPSLPQPSLHDPFFNRDEDFEGMPDEQEKERMLQLAEALLNVDRNISRKGFSIITARNGEMEKIKMEYFSIEHGALEISIFSDYIDYTILWQAGHILLGVLNQCTIAARNAAGYFACCMDSSDPPYDPLVKEGNTLWYYEAIASRGQQLYEPEIVAIKKAWWRFWEK